MKESQKVEIVIVVEKGNKAAQTLNKDEVTMPVHPRKKATGQLLAPGPKKMSKCAVVGLDRDQMTAREEAAGRGRIRMVIDEVTMEGELKGKTLLTLENRIQARMAVGKEGRRRSLLHQTQVQSISSCKVKRVSAQG